MIISYAKLPIPTDIAALQQEVLPAMASQWNAHFNTRHYEGEWMVLALKSPGGSIDCIYADSINNAINANTPLMDAFPSAKKLLAQLKCETNSVRFLNLRAGAVIKEHKDHELAFENGEARIHFPVFTNPKVAFYLDNELIKMQEGEAWYINANLPHRVSNYGSVDRIHLVIDCKVNEWLKSVFDQANKNYRNPAKDNDQLEKIIAELRQQNTVTSLQLADTLSKQLINPESGI